MPEEHRLGAERVERPGRVTVVVRPRKDDDGECVAGARSRVCLQRDLVALDQRVGEQLLAHPLDRRAGLLGIRRVEVEVDDATDSGIADREPELAERASTACPCGSRMPGFGRTSTVALTESPPSGRRRSRRRDPVSRSNAST